MRLLRTRWFIMGAAFAVWLVAYSWFWNERYASVMHYRTALWRWLGDFVLLQWVDQTLGAGLLAFGGGAFVYLVARGERRARLAERSESTLNLHRGQLYEVNRLIRTIGNYASSLDFDRYRSETDQGLPHRLRQDLSALKGVLSGVVAWAPLLSTNLTLLVTGIERATDKYIERETDATRARLKNALLAAAYAEIYFENSDRLLTDEGKFVNKPVEAIPEIRVPPALREFFK